MLRKILAGLFILFACCVARGEQWAMTINSSTRCIPCADPVGAGKTVAAWTNGVVVVAGNYYTNNAGKAYMALTSGTSTNQPVNKFTSATNDAVTWMNCSTFRWSRGLTVCVISGPEVHFNVNRAATTNCPWLVNRTFTIETPTQDYFFIPAGGQSARISFLAQ